MIPHTPQYAQYRDHQLREQPDCDVDRLRVLKQLPTVLDADQRLGHHDADVHPALGAHSFALGVCDIAVVLLYGWRDYDAYEYKSAGDQRVAGRKLKHVLEEEGVQLGGLPH